MILQQFQMVFSKPKFKLAEREFKVYCSEFNSHKSKLLLFTEQYTYNTGYGNIFIEDNTYTFYTVTFCGKREKNRMYAVKYFKELLKIESVYSEQHNQRYIKFLNDMKEL